MNCRNCGRPIEKDEAAWFHPDTMQANCVKRDDESMTWSETQECAEPSPYEVEVRLTTGKVFEIEAESVENAREEIDTILRFDCPSLDEWETPEDGVEIQIAQDGKIIEAWETVDPGSLTGRAQVFCEYTHEPRSVPADWMANDIDGNWHPVCNKDIDSWWDGTPEEDIPKGTWAVKINAYRAKVQS